MSSYSAAACQVTLTASETTVSQMYDWLERAAQRRPQRVALEFAGERGLTYEELLQAARSRAAHPPPLENRSSVEKCSEPGERGSR